MVGREWILVLKAKNRLNGKEIKSNREITGSISEICFRSIWLAIILVLKGNHPHTSQHSSFCIA